MKCPTEPIHIFYTGYEDMYGNPLVLHCEVIYRPDRRINGFICMSDGILYVLFFYPDHAEVAKLEDIHMLLERVYTEI